MNSMTFYDKFSSNVQNLTLKSHFDLFSNQKLNTWKVSENK